MRTRTGLRSRLPLLALGLAVALAAAGLLAGVRGTPRSSGAGGAAGSSSAFRWSLPAGTRLVYRLDWSTRQRVPELAPAAAEGDLRLAGRLELRAHGRRDDGWLVEARLDAATRRMAVAGQDLLADDRALGDATAWAVLGDDGSLRAVEVGLDAPALWQNLAPALLGQLEVVVPATPGAAWVATQRGPFGRGAVRYAASAGRDLVRVRAAYDVIDGLPPADAAQVAARPQGEGRVRLGDGHLRGIVERERLVIARPDGAVRLEGEASLELELLEAGRFVVDPLAAHAPRRRLDPAAVAGDVDAARAALRARVDGLTAEELLAGVLLLADGSLPDEERWTWRASGLLRLEPALCGALAGVFAEGRLTREGRALALDLLSGAGTPEAQTAMIAALRSPPAREHAPDWRRYVQRLSFLDAPTAETVAFAREARREAAAAGDEHGARAAAYVIGNLAGSLGAAGDEAGARALADELGRDLARADEPADRAALLVAYGAAGRPDAADVAAGFVADTHAEVRRAAVDAVAEAPGERAQALLVGLAADGDSMVQEAALAALGGRALSAGELASIAGLVQGGGLAGVNELALAAFANAQRRRGADLAPLAPALHAVAQQTGDPQVRALVKQALGG